MSRSKKETQATDTVALELVDYEGEQHAPKKPASAEDALARGMIASMCAGNIDQAKRMLQCGNLTMCEFELHQALEKIQQMKNL